MELLYKDLSSADAGAIAAALEENTIDYNMSDDGSSVNVSSEDVGKARMLLAQAGLPNGGSMGYELFDKKAGFGTTNFVQNINQVRALEGELSRTISSLEPIRSARVHLVLPQRELFSRENRAASASVFLGLVPGAQLEKEQIIAIQSLVGSAVPELKPQNVSLIDSHGKLLARGGDESEQLLTLKAEEMRLNYEKRLSTNIEDMIGRVVGYGKVRATVTADLNFDRISTNEELYDPETQVIRSSQIIEENNTERDAPPGDVSVQNNLPGIANDLLVDPKPSLESNRIEEVTNFEISKTIKSTVREVGEIKKLSVAVLIDGRYTTDVDGNRVYQPRTQQELDKIASLVRSAIGFDDMRGDNVEVINMQFADIDVSDDTGPEDTLFGFEKADLLDAAEIITVAIMIILVILLILQPMVSRLLEAEAESEKEFDSDLLAGGKTKAALAGPEFSEEDFEPPSMDEADDSLIDMQQVEGKVKASSVKKVEDIVDSYPNETVSVLRSWARRDTL
jgi:flagellar M-ring protein FliF